MTSKLAACCIVIALAGYSVGRAGYSLEQLRHVIVPANEVRVERLEKHLRALQQEVNKLRIERWEEPDRRRRPRLEL
jgi:hypothetical protein